MPDPKDKTALERMASVVSHELRNPLAVINNSVYYVKSRLQSANAADAKVTKHLSIIESEIKQANDIISEIHAFARRLELRPEAVKPQLALEEALQEARVPSTIKVVTKAAPQTPMVSADPEKLKQALTALVRNAVEAMPSGGSLKLSTSVQDNGALFEVVDTGAGIPPETAPEVFEPFFTTKPRGVGLGLTIARRIIEAHGGKLTIDSEVGKGAAAKVWLPAKK